jgi:putative Mn2+ efflux pump MntP
VTYLSLASPHKSIYIPAIVVAEVLIFMCTGPVNSAIVSEVKPIERATAMGLAVFVMHLVGDIPSQPLIGYLSDRSTLAQGILVVPLAVVLAGIIWIVAARLRDA